jgi:thiosulfate dehydrogenase [quinone] large subunit
MSSAQIGYFPPRPVTVAWVRHRLWEQEHMTAKAHGPGYRPAHRPRLPPRHPGPSAVASRRTGSQTSATRCLWAVARLSLGWVFLWAFLDKTFGLGHDTTDEQSWLNGGHPTQDFLKLGTRGPLAGLYRDLAGATVVDWLFMIGLAAVGTALILGIGMRIAAAAGALLMVMMWTAVLPPAGNPFMDDHLIYALVLIGVALVGAGDALGLGRWWGGTDLVRSLPILK